MCHVWHHCHVSGVPFAAGLVWPLALMSGGYPGVVHPHEGAWAASSCEVYGGGRRCLTMTGGRGRWYLFSPLQVVAMQAEIGGEEFRVPQEAHLHLQPLQHLAVG